MKIAIGSDLHYDAHPKLITIDDEAELILFAGDYCNGRSITHGGLVSLSEKLKQQGVLKDRPIIDIRGNHEYYGLGVHPKSSVGYTEYKELKIVYCTLWTDFFNENPTEMFNGGNALNDYRVIRNEEGVKWSPYLQVQLFKKELKRLKEYIKEHKPHVIMTHHAPSRLSIEDKFKTSNINGCFANDLDDVVENSGAQYWIHGHMHQELDYMIGNTRVICNPSDYRNDRFSFRTLEVKL